MQGKKVLCEECACSFTARPEPAASRREKAEPREKGKRSGRDRPGKAKPQSSPMPWVIGGVAVCFLGLLVLTAAGFSAWFLVASGKAKNSQVTPLSRGEGPVGGFGVDKEPVGPEGQLSAQVLQRLKDATVFIKVDAGRVSGSGSGFLCKVQGDTGYVVTNHHVVNPEAELLRPVPHRIGLSVNDVRIAKRKPNNAKISVVFNSGTTAERVLQAAVVAIDDARDLAVLRVQGLSTWPTPIDPVDRGQLGEKVFILGFPFGEELAGQQGNPTVTINVGSVTSQHEPDFGHLQAVRIDGINLGNSGGPVVNEDGSLAGVSVATRRGAGSGMAIAAQELERMFRGGVSPVGLTLKSLDDAGCEFDAAMNLIDPLGQITAASILYKGSASGELGSGWNRDGSLKSVEGAQLVDLQLQDQQATGSFKLKFMGTDVKYLVIQTRYVNRSSVTVHSQVESRWIVPPSPAIPAPPSGKSTVTTPNDGLGGSTTTLGQVSFSEVKVNASQLARPLLWAPGGTSFYVLEKNTGVVRKFAVQGLKETLKANLAMPCSWMSPSAEGIVVTASNAREVYVLDHGTLKRKSTIAVANVQVVASAPGLSVAFAISKGATGEEAVSVLDLKKGAVARRYRSIHLAARLLGYRDPTVTPDGKYLITWGGLEQLHRFKIAGTTLTYEESSNGIARNGQSIAVSPDSKWVALPSGGGNAGANTLHATLIFPVTDLSRAALTVHSGAYPRTLGFDSKLGYVYAHNVDHPLIIFTNKALKLKEFSLPGAGQTSQLAVHPDGGSLLLLTDSKLFHVVVKKL